jgi:chitodextrinase
LSVNFNHANNIENIICITGKGVDEATANAEARRRQAKACLNAALFTLIVIIPFCGALAWPVGMWPGSDYRDAPAPGVVINEFVANPATGNDWIELYNPTASSVSLDLWTIRDGANNSLDLTGKSLPAGGYLVLDFSNKLNKDGDIIYLENGTASIDQVAYGNWLDGETTGNAPAPGTGQSAGRYPNGQDTDTDSADFILFDTPTPGAPNLPPPPAATVQIGDTRANPGETTILPLWIYNASNLGSIDLELRYNHTVVRVTNATPGDFEVMIPNLEQNATGFVKLVAFQAENPGLNGTVVLSYLMLTAVGKPGETSPLNLTVMKLTDVQPECRDIPHETRNGTFAINRPPVADAGPDLVVSGTETALFNASGSYDPDGEIVSYAWDFGDGGNATGCTVNHTYTTTGTFIVTVTVTDDTGAADNDTCTVTVNSPPIAAAGEDRVVLPNDSVEFNGSGSYDLDGEIVGYAWDFGDGSNATGCHVTHLYALGGTYLVTLTVTDSHNATGMDSCTIIVCLNGDVNRNGVVEISDAMYLARHITGINGFEVIAESICDVNDNGAVEISDAMYLAKHIAGITGFEELR